MSQDYNELENQIGNLGGEEAPKKPGKLKYKSSYGQKEDLDDQEKQSFDNFMKRSKKAEENSDAPISQGWIPVDRSELGERSKFYPADWEFMVRPATLQAIKNWTAIDEERPDVVNKVFNEIIKTCVKIVDGNGVGVPWSQMNSWDRFWFVLKIREYTFVNGESKIEFEDSCSECDTDILYTLTSDALFYEFPDDDLIDKYWQDGEWVIDPSEYDVDHDVVTLYTPKLGKDDAIIEWATRKARNKQKLDETFINFLPWMLNKPSKDDNLLDKQIIKLEKEYKSWNLEMFSFMSDVIKNITINPSEQLKVTCPNCGQEATSTVQFPNGVKTLFEVKSKAKKFGSK